MKSGFQAFSSKSLTIVFRCVGKGVDQAGESSLSPAAISMLINGTVTDADRPLNWVEGVKGVEVQDTAWPWRLNVGYYPPFAIFASRTNLWARDLSLA